MAIKSFNEMRALDLSEHIQKKPTFYKDKDGKLKTTSEDKWLDYIEWAVVLDLLYKHGAEKVFFTSELHPTHTNTLIIRLAIDGEEFTTNYPIINGNSVINQPNQLQIHNSEMRGFVKAVAIHTGLGLSLWMKEERVNSEFLTDSHTIKLNAKKLMENSETESELMKVWNAMTENEQVKFKDVFSKRRKEIIG